MESSVKADALPEGDGLDVLLFHRHIVLDFLEQDGIAVMGKGLGMHTVVAALLVVHQMTEDSGGVVVVIGTNAGQRKMIVDDISRLQPGCPSPPDINSDFTSVERMEMYNQVKHLFITTRILVVDLLTGRLPTKKVAGIIVMNAHRVRENSGEGFAVRLFREGNKEGFVRAFTDEAMQLSSSFSTLERVMRALYVRNLFLWPRFQDVVKDSLSEVEVFEVECEMSPSMIAIQSSLVKVLDSVLREVQRANKLDSTELDLKNALYTSFERIIHRQLDPIWNTLSARTQQLVRDMRTVQELIQYLLRFNPVSFLRYLHCLKAAASMRTEWLFHSAANTVFQEAKARVYCLVSSNPKSKTTKSKSKAGQAETAAATTPVHLAPVLEEMPKWGLLRDIVEEVQMQRGLLLSHAGSSGAGDGGNQDGAADQVEAPSITATPKLPSTAARAPTASAAADTPAPDASSSKVTHSVASALGVDVEEIGGSPKAPSEAAPPSTVTLSAKHIQSAGNEVVDLVDEDEGGGEDAAEEGGAHDWIQCVPAAEAAELAAAPVLVVAKEIHMLSELRAILQAGGGTAYLQKLYDMYLIERISSRQAGTSGRGAPRPGGVSRGRGRSGSRSGGRSGGMTRAENNMYRLQQLNASLEEEQAMQVAAEAAAAAAAQDETSGNKRPSKAQKTAAGQSAAAGGGKGVAEADDSSPLLQGVTFAAMDDACESLLWSLRPVFVIMYDLDLAWTRALELFRSQNPDRPFKVYLLSYHESVDSAKFQMSATKEKESFVDLIRKKAHLVLPVDEAGKHIVIGQKMAELQRHSLLTGGMAAAGNALTRRAGGQNQPDIARRVIVDIREFVSTLPGVLHHQGMHITPLTLEVADFVLSPEICVERKAIPDLISSLDSGRLYTQAEAMCKHYSTPVLLIEFDPDRAFALQSMADIGDDIRANNIASKLVLLLHHFPKLRVVWSRSLHATADLFFVLKRNRPEPDAAVAGAVGIDPAAQSASSNIANPTARDMLLRMPGVTAANVRPLMEAAGSLQGLAKMSLEEVHQALGKQPGKSLYEFLHQSYPVSG